MTDEQTPTKSPAPAPPKTDLEPEQTKPPTDEKKPQTPPEPKAASNKKYTNSKDSQTMAKKSSKPVTTIIAALIIVIAGVGTGYALSQVMGAGSGSEEPVTATPEDPTQIAVGETYGSKPNGFPDEAEGVLVSGGTDGEGTHRLLRPGGESQIICITSSVLDMDLFTGHQIAVWGETFDTPKCGWFMDVGRVEVKELNAEKPFELEEEVKEDEEEVAE